jgi:hypothetical protein
VERHTVVAGSSSVAASDNTSGTNNEINLPSRNNNNRNSSSISIEQGAEPNAETSDNRAILMELGVHMEL